MTVLGQFTGSGPRPDSNPVPTNHRRGRIVSPSPGKQRELIVNAPLLCYLAAMSAASIPRPQRSPPAQGVDIGVPGRCAGREHGGPVSSNTNRTFEGGNGLVAPGNHVSPFQDIVSSCY